MKKIEKAAAKIINKAINIETYGWPPVCMGAMYVKSKMVYKGARRWYTPTALRSCGGSVAQWMYQIQQSCSSGSRRQRSLRRNSV